MFKKNHNITKEDSIERNLLINEFKKLPSDFFSKIRHFQPQIGCLNACSICSKYAGNNMSYWTEERIKNIVYAIKETSKRKEKPYIVWNRENHRNGVIFSYLDNDVGNYYYLDRFIKIVYEELGVITRISTVGFSRHNKKLNKMHKKISKNYNALAGVRLSFTPYAKGWSICNKIYSRKEYEKDMINFLKIYKKYYKKVGSGSRNFCVELRFKPLVINSNVIIYKHKNKFIIYTNKYLYISIEENIKFENTYIKDAKIHRLSLTTNPIKFNKIKLNKVLNTKNEINNYLKNNINKIEKTVDIYQVKNSDGYYYAIDPILTDNGNYGIYIYEKTNKRPKSGYIITERFFLNTLLKYKRDNNFKKATWKDVKNVLNNLEELSKYYKNIDQNISNYIINELHPMIKSYIVAIKKSGYNPKVFFDKGFTIDTGIICNLGRAIKEFKGLVSAENEPVTLNHERNYGKYNSTMVLENTSWRLSCGYDNTIIIEKLNMNNTATRKGQVAYQKIVKLNKMDETLNNKNLFNEYLIPGQRKKI